MMTTPQNPDSRVHPPVQTPSTATPVNELRPSKTRRTGRKKKPLGRKSPIIWSIAGGKGGTGKSVITANLGIGLTLVGKRVILLDGDLGGPNLHNYLNLRRPQFNLNDFIMNRCDTLEDATTTTPLEGLRVISGGTDLLGTANLNHMKKEKMLRHIHALDADYVIVDLGAGTTFNTIDFFNTSNRGFVVANPEPNAKYDAFYFLKNALFRKLGRTMKRGSKGHKLLQQYLEDVGGQRVELVRFLEYVAEASPEVHATVMKILKSSTFCLIMNKIRNRKQQREGEWFVNLVRNYLGIEMECLGNLSFEEKVIASSEDIVPFLFRYPNCSTAKDLFQILTRLGVSPQENYGRASFRRFRSAAKKQASNWIY
jgi:flagellar biosynthesis protein FlhG